VDIRDYLSDDGQAVLALCSALALPEEATEALQPFKLSEWNELERQIQNSPLKCASALRDRTAVDLAKDLGIVPEDAERIVALLGRSGRLALEMENLFSRGIWAVTRGDELYPAQLRQTLKHQAPTVLFGAGEIRLLNQSGVAVVGSRNIEADGEAFARELGAKAARAGLAVVSGGARGTDQIAMKGALEADGKSMGALADSLEATIRKPEVRDLLLEDRLTLVTPYVPTAGFSVGGAMGRNKIIYGLSQFAVVVSSDFETGGTWAGAVEAIKAGWCPVYVRSGANVPKGNRELLKRGAVPLPENEFEGIGNLKEWLSERQPSKVIEQDLFGRS